MPLPVREMGVQEESRLSVSKGKKRTRCDG